MSWETIRLGDIAEFSNGINFDKKAYAPGVKLISVSDFGNLFSPNYETLIEVKQEIVREKDCLKNNDIVFVRSNGNKELVGRCMLLRDMPSIPVTYSGFCIRARLKNTNMYDPVFFTYHFKNIDFRRAMSGTAIGANIQNLSQGKLQSYKAKIPDINTQRHIAGILSAYDDLIENNQKQIKLLEEAAQRLYKEWFVDLHFPGWENTTIIDGVPEGWHEGTLSELAEFKRGKTITKAQVEEGSVPVVAGGLEPAYYHNMANTKKPVITVSGSGANAGFTRLYHMEVYASDCSYVDSDRTDYLEFVYCFLTDNVAKLDSLQKGSAQPHVYAKDINALVLCIPSEIVLQRFCGILRPIYDKIGYLEKQNAALKEARDRLLPKLISGELEV